MILNRDVDSNREPGALVTDPHVLEHKDIQTAVNANTNTVAAHETKLAAQATQLATLTTAQAGLVDQLNTRFAAIGAQLITICTSTTRPTVTTNGTMCFETDTGSLLAWSTTKSQWVGITAALATLATALQVDGKAMVFHATEKGTTDSTGVLTPTLPAYLWGATSKTDTASYLWDTSKLKVGYAGLADSATVGGVLHFAYSALRDAAYFSGQIGLGQSCYVDTVKEVQTLGQDAANKFEWRRSGTVVSGTPSFQRTTSSNTAQKNLAMVASSGRYQYQITNNRLEGNVLLYADQTSAAYNFDFAYNLRMTPPHPVAGEIKTFTAATKVKSSAPPAEMVIGTWQVFDQVLQADGTPPESSLRTTYELSGNVVYIPLYDRIYFAYDTQGRRLSGRRWLSWTQTWSTTAQGLTGPPPRLEASFSYPVDGWFVTTSATTNPRDSMTFTTGANITPDVVGYSDNLLLRPLTVYGSRDVPASTASLTMNTPNIVIRDAEYHGKVTVNAANITFRNCTFYGRNATTYEPLVDCATSGASNIVFEDCTFTPDWPSIYLTGIAGTSFTLRRCDISGVVDGVQVGKTNGTGSYASNVIVEKSWIHNLYYSSSEPTYATGDNQTHNDGIAILGGTGTIVRINNLQTYYGDNGTDIPLPNDTPTPSGAAQLVLRAVSLAQTAGDTSGVTITDNQIGGGVIPVDCTAGATNVGTIQRNTFDGGSLTVNDSNPTKPQTILLKSTQSASTGDGTTNKNTFFGGPSAGQEVFVRHNG